MQQSFYLAYRYLLYHKFRSIVLICSIGLIIFLPNGLQRLIEESEQQMMARADATPLIVGAKGSSTDLIINSLYFQQEKIDNIKFGVTNQLTELGFGYSIPILSTFQTRGYSIVGTNLDYFDFRGLSIRDGRNLSYVGECVVGSAVAENLDLLPGDSLISSPENLFDISGVYPLKMNVVGVLNKSDTPDDKSVFTDIKTTWVIMGLGHGHQDLTKSRDQSVILKKDEKVVTANAKLFMYNLISGENMESFHFHGDISGYPITSIIFVPTDQKASALIRGRFEAKELPNQIVVPSKVIENLLLSIFRIKQIFNTVFVLVGVSTLLILGLIVTLTLRLRKDELYTMFTIGSSKSKTFEILGLEISMVFISSIILAFILYWITGFYVEDFINYYIIG